jgi:hypothetical protein
MSRGGEGTLRIKIGRGKCVHSANSGDEVGEPLADGKPSPPLSVAFKASSPSPSPLMDGLGESKMRSHMLGSSPAMGNVSSAGCAGGAFARLAAKAGHEEAAETAEPEQHTKQTPSILANTVKHLESTGFVELAKARREATHLATTLVDVSHEVWGPNGEVDRRRELRAA